MCHNYNPTGDLYTTHGSCVMARKQKALDRHTMQGPSLEEVLGLIEKSLARAARLRPEEQVNLLGDKWRYIDALSEDITTLFAKFTKQEFEQDDKSSKQS